MTFRLASGVLAIAALVGVARAQTATRAAATAAAGTQSAATRPGIRIGYDTTRIEKPLRADGTPDYVAALNEKYRQGVTTENNAAVKIIEALGPTLLSDGARGRFLAGLDMTLPSDRRYFAIPADKKVFEAIDKAMRGPWRRGDYPELAEWLDGNAEVFARMTEASARQRFYFPILPFGWGEPAGTKPPIVFGLLRQALRAMVDRANLAWGEGRMEDCRRDLVSACRLGMLLQQDSSLTWRFVGEWIVSGAVEEMKALAVSGDLSASDARALLAAIAETGPVPDMASCVDKDVRYEVLDMLIWFAREPGLARLEAYAANQPFMTVSGPDTPAPVRAAADRAMKQVDWTVLLREANQACDRTMLALRHPTFTERIKALPPDRGADAATQFTNLFVPLLDRCPPPVAEGSEAATKWAGQWVFMPWETCIWTQVRMDLANVWRDLTMVALALAAYRVEKGKYPDKLTDLAPDCLKAVPDDFCSGKPFLYRSDGKTFLLYSVGENTQDDGGKARGEGVGFDDIVVKAPGEAPPTGF